MLYHALIVRLAPVGPHEPSTRRAWWSGDRRAANAEPRHHGVQTIPQLSALSRHSGNDRTAKDNRQAA